MLGNDDEWEIAELRLANFSLNTRNNDASTRVEIPMPVSRNDDIVKATFPIPPPVTMISEPIDDALMSAITNPRERLLILNTEHQILEFLKSSEGTKVFPQNLNSYRRLLLHRLAQRFKLTRSVLEDGSIVLLKNSDIIIPNLLLVDVPCEIAVPELNSLPREPSSDSINSVDSVDRNGTKSDSAKSKTSSGVVSGNQKKVVMMKRDTNNDQRSSKKELQSKQLNQVAADKARQYAEAKARIFGSEVEDSEFKLTRDADSIVPNVYRQDCVVDNSNDSSYPSSVSNASSESLAYGRSMYQMSMSGMPIKESANTLSQKQSSKAGKKSVERDRGADERDPDFMRQSYPSLNPSARSNSGTTLSVENGSGPESSYPLSGVFGPNFNSPVPSIPINFSQSQFSSNYYYDYSTSQFSQPSYDNRLPPAPNQGWITPQTLSSQSVYQNIAPPYTQLQNSYYIPNQSPSFPPSGHPAVYGSTSTNLSGQANANRYPAFDPNEFPPLR